ncbi:MAG: hypothetical protein QOD96_402 [Pseudonocardiales bacterium]|nr:hypothetical protein [Pseudonocardiales bacterium]
MAPDDLGTDATDGRSTEAPVGPNTDRRLRVVGGPPTDRAVAQPVDPSQEVRGGRRQGELTVAVGHEPEIGFQRGVVLDPEHELPVGRIRASVGERMGYAELVAQAHHENPQLVHPWIEVGAEAAQRSGLDELGPGE